MTRTAVRLTLAVACLAAGWLAGSLPRVRAQDAAAGGVTSISTAGAGTLYVVRGGEPYQCHVGQVPGSSLLETTSAWVCDPLPLHYR